MNRRCGGKATDNLCIGVDKTQLEEDGPLNLGKSLAWKRWEKIPTSGRRRIQQHLLIHRFKNMLSALLF
jgi:hypothetical protein